MCPSKFALLDWLETNAASSFFEGAAGISLGFPALEIWFCRTSFWRTEPSNGGIILVGSQSNVSRSIKEAEVNLGADI